MRYIFFLWLQKLKIYYSSDKIEQKLGRILNELTRYMSDTLFQNKLGFLFLWDSLNRKAKKELIQRLIANLEITRDKNYNIEIKNIKFMDEFISKRNIESYKKLNERLSEKNKKIMKLI